MKSYLIIITILITHFSNLFAQKTFQRSYGKEGDDNAYGVALNENKEILMIGLTKSYSNTKSVFLNLVDSLGNHVWSRVIEGENTIIARVAKPTSDGGYIISGNTVSAEGAGKKDALLMKLKSNGELDWSKVYGGELNDYAFDMVETLDGGFLVVGETNSFGVSGSDIFVYKVNRYGELEWGKAMGAANVEYGYSIKETLDGYIIASETNSFGAGGWDVSLTKLNKEGELLWFSTYGSEKDDYGYSIDVSDSLDIYMTGSTSSFGMGGRDIYLFHINKSGELKSGRTIGDVHDEQGHVVKCLPDGGVAIAGFSNSYQSQLNAEDAFLIRFSSHLHLKWSKVFGGVFGDYALDLAVDDDLNYYMVGETYSFHGRSDKDAYLVKVTDNPRDSYCAQARVQAIPLKVTEDIQVNRYDLKSKNVTPKVSTIEFKEKEVLTYEHVICTDHKELIDGKRRK